jgi:hypothetical protein
MNILSVLHSRFRLDLTTLNDDLYKRSLIDNPNCICNTDRETYSHFILHCPVHIFARRQLFIEITQLLNSCGLAVHDFTDEQLLHHLIYGFDFELKRLNVTLFASVHKFLITTNRFQF